MNFNNRSLRIFVFFTLIFIINLNVSAGGYFDYLVDNSYCRWTECCNDDYIPADIYKLQKNLDQKVFGQHLVQRELVAALDAHYNGEKPRKPLVLSFNGTPGTGKSMVANLIVDAIYAKGVKSQFVKIFNGRVSFPLTSQAENYNTEIADKVRIVLKTCPRSMFIFNEVNKMPNGIFESLSSMIDYPTTDSTDSQAVFIFISNTAGTQISDRLGDLMKGSLAREATELNHFEDIIRLTAFNLEGGLKKTAMITSHVIDHYIPFLPLEVSHVRQCLEAEYKYWGDTLYGSNSKRIDAIIEKSVTFDASHGIFSAYGCKGLDKDVALDIRRQKLEL